MLRLICSGRMEKAHEPTLVVPAKAGIQCLGAFVLTLDEQSRWITSPHPRLAPRAIRCADVRFGILLRSPALGMTVNYE